MNLRITAQDCRNIVALLEKCQVTGPREAEALLLYIRNFKDAAAAIATEDAQKANEEPEPPTSEFRKFS